MLDPCPDTIGGDIPQAHGLLPHIAYNSSGKATILLIHGGFSAGSEWDLIVPHLSRSFHLLIPDLPAHGQSRHIIPFSLEHCSRLLSQLIKEKAKNGVAHVVGISLGALVTIDLASRYPDAVRSVFVSGYEVFPTSRFTPYMPYVVWIMLRPQDLVPRPVARWLMDGTDVRRGDQSIYKLDLCRQIVNTLNTDQWPSSWPARTLIVAAGKRGFLPSNDHPQDARRLMQIGNKANPDTVAVTHPLMRHAWDRQAPLLFAETARAWIEGEELPSGFQRL